MRLLSGIGPSSLSTRAVFGLLAVLAKNLARLSKLCDLLFQGRIIGHAAPWFKHDVAGVFTILEGKRSSWAERLASINFVE